jgi:H+/Cl- antiporter ClcA
LQKFDRHCRGILGVLLSSRFFFALHLSLFIHLAFWFVVLRRFSHGMQEKQDSPDVLEKVALFWLFVLFLFVFVFVFFFFLKKKNTTHSPRPLPVEAAKGRKIFWRLRVLGGKARAGAASSRSGEAEQSSLVQLVVSSGRVLSCHLSSSCSPESALCAHGCQQQRQQQL